MQIIGGTACNIIVGGAGSLENVTISRVSYIKNVTMATNNIIVYTGFSGDIT